MGEHTRKSPHQGRPGTLGELIHEAVRHAIEVAVEEELTAALGVTRYTRDAARDGYRNGHRGRTLTGPTGPLALTLPRATLFATSGRREWTSALVPRYQRRLREVNEAVVATLKGTLIQGRRSEQETPEGSDSISGAGGSPWCGRSWP